MNITDFEYHYHLVAYSYDKGEDDKNDCPNFTKAKVWAKQWLKEGWEKVTIYKVFTTCTLMVAEVTKEGIRRITNND